MFSKKQSAESKLQQCKDQVKDFVHDCRTPLVTVDITLKVVSEFLNKEGVLLEEGDKKLIKLVRSAQSELQRVNEKLTVLAEMAKQCCWGAVGVENTGDPEYSDKIK